MRVEKHPLQERVERMLLDFGGFFTFEDILYAIQVGEMQSFALGESWAVTRICVFPQKAALEIVLAVGNMKELELLHTDITGWARERGIPALFTYNARLGFDAVKLPGWKKAAAVFVKDLTDGS
jgi:hypothetical protein